MNPHVMSILWAAFSTGGKNFPANYRPYTNFTNGTIPCAICYRCSIIIIRKGKYLEDLYFSAAVRGFWIPVPAFVLSLIPGRILPFYTVISVCTYSLAKDCRCKTITFQSF